MINLERTLYITIFSIISFSLTGQKQPEMVAPGIVSDNGVFGYTLSPDSKTALWVKSGGGRDTLMIFESHFNGTRWDVPRRATFSNDGAWKDIDPVFSPDGKKVLFQSTRSVPGKPQRKGFDIWAVDRTKGGWSEPYHLGNDINSDESESYASITRAGHIYFMKENPDGQGSSDIYVSRFYNGKYQQPENVGAPINTSFRESNPFISADEDYLIYFSSDSAGFGNVDLMISYRSVNGWSAPENLGVPINTEDSEFCPFYHTREKRLYFARQKKTQPRFIENIFMVDVDVFRWRK
jgi:hypothetical protein